jgi:O-antigen/teichoic acid export membrane protein
MPIRKLARSSALRSALGFALGGGGFALANVILAREMSSRDYGLVVLFIALTQLGATLGSAGMDTVTVRHRVGPSAHLFMRVLASATLLGGISAIAMIALFDIGLELSCLLIAAIVLAALNRLGCSFLQSLAQYRRGLGVMLAHNGVLLAATLILLAADSFQVEALAVMLTVGYAVSTAYGWEIGRKQLKTHALRDSLKSYGREGFTIVASQISVAVLNQLDRLLIPRLMSAGALGQYAAASTLCASPFNLLQCGARYSLLPKLRACTRRSEAFRLIRHEALATLAMVIIAGAGCVLLAPAVSDWLFKGRYVLEQDLVEVLVLLGVLKIWDSFATSCVQAIGSKRSLTMLSIAGWVALGVALVGAFMIQQKDLVAIVSAIAFAWFTLCVAGTCIALQAVFGTRSPWRVESYEADGTEAPPKERVA